MAELLTFENLGNLAVLIFLQAVLGFDNLLYISIESQRAPKESQAKVRQMGIIIAVALRIVLLFVMVSLIDSLKDPFFDINWTGVLEGSFNFATLVFLFGGALILADGVAAFLEKNRMYEVLGLFILLIVGVVLLGEGGHLAHMKVFGFEIVPMSKATFYFSIFVLFIVEIVQSGYQRKLDAERGKFKDGHSSR